jgi:hypothetical protein
MGAAACGPSWPGKEMHPCVQYINEECEGDFPEGNEFIVLEPDRSVP